MQINTQHQERVLLITLAMLQFTHILDFMILMPLGPLLQVSLHVSDHQFASLISGYSAAAAVAGIGAVFILDRVNRKWLLMAMYSMLLLATFLCAIAPNYNLLLCARAVAGACGGVVSALVLTIIADIIPFERRGSAIGLVMTSFSVASVIGVPVGLKLATMYSWHAPFVAIVLVGVVVLCLLGVVMPSLAALPNKSSPIKDFKQVFSDINHWRAFAYTTAALSSAFLIIPLISIYMTSSKGVTQDQLFLFYLFGGLATFFSGPWIGKWSDRVGKLHAIRVVGVASLVPIVLITNVTAVGLLGSIVIGVLFMVLISGRNVISTTLITGTANPAVRGAFMSVNNTVQSASMAIASLVGGFIVARSDTGALLHFGWVGVLSIILSLSAIYLAEKLQLHGS